MALMGPALWIAAKELRQRARDRSLFIIGIAVPLVLAAILGFALSDVDDEGFTTSYAIADEDGGALAQNLVTAVEDLEFAEVTRAETADEAVRLVDAGDVRAAFIIPSGFTSSVQRGEGAQLRVVADPEAAISAQIAEAIARSYASELNAVQLAIATVLSEQAGPPDPATVEALAERASAAPPSAMLDQAVADDHEVDAQTFFAIGMAVFFMFFTVEFGVRSLLEERQTGTMSRLLAAPMRPRSIIAGKALASFAAGLVSMTVLIVATDVLLGARWGDPLGVAALVVAGVLAAVGVMALVATLAKTPEQSGSYASVAAVTMGLLGGAFFPLGDGLLARISLATPHAWLLEGLRDLSAGAGLGGVLGSLGAVLAFAAVTGTAALIRAGALVERA